MSDLWRQVRENSTKLENCKRHRFPGEWPIKLGARHSCLNCGGEMQLTNIGSYIRGYEAAGGSADDIWPGYRKEHK